MLSCDRRQDFLQELPIIGKLSRVLVKANHGRVAGRQEVQVMLVLEDAPEVAALEGIFIRDILALPCGRIVDANGLGAFRGASSAAPGRLCARTWY